MSASTNPVLLLLLLLLVLVLVLMSVLVFVLAQALGLQTNDDNGFTAINISASLALHMYQEMLAARNADENVPVNKA